ncbi:dTMP kinase [Thermoleophilia bacterium SCSIO 60948]|nr:dTMP kinase [Thermoleophilia bacterium SCSIO 60948]
MFITLEGIDRSGKTTQTARLIAALGEAGSEVLALREPGGTPVGERIRELLLDPGVELDPRTELMLFCAARAELCATVIRPALDAGRDVVCDRFVDSTVAYQGVGRGLGRASAEAACDAAIGGCVPDLTLLLRIDPAAALARGQQRLAAGEDDGTDRFESEGAGFQRRIAEAYDEQASRHPERIVVIDAEGTPDEVHGRVMAAVAGRRG